MPRSHHHRRGGGDSGSRQGSSAMPEEALYQNMGTDMGTNMGASSQELQLLENVTFREVS